jgi:hypothetical protein
VKEEFRDLDVLFTRHNYNHPARIKWEGHAAQKMDKINAYMLMMGKLERKTPLGRPRGRWEDNIIMYLVETVLGGVDWIGLVQDRQRW